MSVYLHAFAAMGTVVSLRVIGNDDTASKRADREELVREAVGWFRSVEAACDRFDPSSELSQLTTRIGVPTHVSTMLYQATEFALALAEETGGAFDPTVGSRMARRGFNRSYQSGEVFDSGIPADIEVSFRDVELGPDQGTITLLRPLLLDLGAVAKGLAIDLAARTLAPLENFSIDAGGDLYLGGRDDEDGPWLVGIRHPREEGKTFETFRVSDAAVCTSGDYERTNSEGEHHIIDPRTGAATPLVASVSVITSPAILADGLATAAMVLGPLAGMSLIEGQGAEGVILSTRMERFATSGIARYATVEVAMEGALP